MHLKKLKYKVEVFKRLKYSEVYLKYTSSNLKYIWSMLQVYVKYTSLLNSWWTQSILETYKFKLFFKISPKVYFKYTIYLEYRILFEV